MSKKTICICFCLVICPEDYPYHGEDSMYVDYHICWKSSGASLDDASCENWCIAEENIEIDQESANHLANCPNNICASKCPFVKLNLKFCRFVFKSRK